MLLTIESDVDLIITCLMSKSLCLGWSCETGPSRNITTVMVFQNSTQIVTLQHLVCQGYMVYSSCRNINNCTTKQYVFCVFPPVPPPSISFFHFYFFPHLFCCLNALFPLCLPDGAAMRAGVQTGDRIIKVLCSSAFMSVNC